MTAATTHKQEIESGERFSFGDNWARFLALLDDERIRQAEDSLRKMLDTDSLAGKRFVDIGSGSGLFSLAARRLGATVHSFDYDPQSVACTAELRRRYFPGDPNWTVEEASALDLDYLAQLGQFDIVYSWGVLHHTGKMWEALANVAPLVADGGKLFIALYNDQGYISKRWNAIKKAYVSSSKPIKAVLVGACYVHFHWRTVLSDFKRLQPFKTFRDYKRTRGMSVHRDMIDWVGGYPFEVSKPEEIFRFYRSRGFDLVDMKTCGGGLGCNEFVFQKSSGR